MKVPSLKSVWFAAGRDFLRIWLLGWRVISQVVIGSLILTVSFLPLHWLIMLGSRIPILDQSTTLQVAARVTGALLVSLVYVPLAFYVAASWVGLCPWIGHERRASRR